MEVETKKASWVGGIATLTLFVEDLVVARKFYVDIFRVPIVFEDEVSVVFNFKNTLINLLHILGTDELISPAKAATQAAGSRYVLTIEVEDVDAVCEELTAGGVTLLNGPMDRPWGIRTASFKDPGGHIWEISMPLSAG